MNTLKLGFRLLSVLMAFAISALVISCNEESAIAFGDKQSVSSEANTDSFYEDVEDISATVSLADGSNFSGRAAGLDDRFCAETKLRLLSKQSNNPDTIIVNFGAGCTDPRGNIRKGAIIIVFTPGTRFQVGNTVTTTFDGFSVNGVKVQGTRTVTLTSLDPPTHKIVLVDGKLTWPDNSFATRDAQHFRKWDRNGTPNLLTDDKMVIFGTNDFPAGASGQNRNGNEYTMQVVEDIVFKVECAVQRKFMPVSGKKVLTVGDKTITVNYGSGNCDNTITVTINGESQEVTVTRE